MWGPHDYHVTNAGVLGVWERGDDGSKRNCQRKRVAVVLSLFVSRAQFVRGRRKKVGWEQAGQMSESGACAFHKDFLYL